MDCLAFVVIGISRGRQSVIWVGADLGEFCAAVLRRLATAEQNGSENGKPRRTDQPFNSSCGRTSISSPKPSHRQKKNPEALRGGEHQG